MAAGMPTPEQRADQVRMDPMLTAMRKVFLGRGVGRGEDLGAAKRLYETEPKEFLRLMKSLQETHDRKKRLKRQRVEKAKERREGSAGDAATTSAAGPVPEVVPSPAAESAQAETPSAASALVERLLGR